jgi:hypothetical protein
MPTIRFVIVAAAMSSLALPTPAGARFVGPCPSGYAYVGVESPARGFGVSATLKTVTRAVVDAGHVAAWVGVGGPGLGPGGTDEWLQAGIAQDAGGSDVVYYEYKRPGDEHATYVPIAPSQAGRKYTFIVYEQAAQRDSWRVMVDGAKVGDPITLPGSHGTFQPLAMVESWDGGVTGTCNGFGYDFSNLAVRTQYAGVWQAFDLTRVLHDPVYLLTLRASGFVASSR